MTGTKLHFFLKPFPGEVPEGTKPEQTLTHRSFSLLGRLRRTSVEEPPGYS
jgi:hypothetical protein